MKVLSSTFLKRGPRDGTHHKSLLRLTDVPCLGRGLKFILWENFKGIIWVIYRASCFFSFPHC